MLYIFGVIYFGDSSKNLNKLSFTINIHMCVCVSVYLYMFNYWDFLFFSGVESISCIDKYSRAKV